MTTAGADLSLRPAAPIARTRPRSRSARRLGAPLVAVAPVAAAEDRSPCRVSADVMAVLAAFGLED